MFVNIVKPKLWYSKFNFFFSISKGVVKVWCFVKWSGLSKLRTFGLGKYLLRRNVNNSEINYLLILFISELRWEKKKSNLSFVNVSTHGFCLMQIVLEILFLIDKDLKFNSIIWSYYCPYPYNWCKYSISYILLNSEMLFPC